MLNKQDELIKIINKFASSGWDLIEIPAKRWLIDNKSTVAVKELISAIEEADKQCGSCGCEFDPLYKKFLEMKSIL